MSDDDEVEFITNTNPIAAKAKAIAGKTADDLLKTVDQRVSGLKQEFSAILKQDGPKIFALMQEAEKDPAACAQPVEGMRKLAHELRGQGTTFGYPLVTEICDSFCKFVEALKPVSAQHLPLLRAHIDALRAIVGADIKGDGGDIGRELMKGLRAIRQKAESESGEG